MKKDNRFGRVELNYNAFFISDSFFIPRAQTRDLMNNIDQLLEKKVEVPRIHSGKRQAIETLINEETLLFARYLRDESESWNPRINTP